MTEKQIKILLDLTKISIPMLCNKYRAVDDPGTALKEIIEKAKKERENAAKVPDQKKSADGSIVVEEIISE